MTITVQSSCFALDSNSVQDILQAASRLERASFFVSWHPVYVQVSSTTVWFSRMLRFDN